MASQDSRKAAPDAQDTSALLRSAQFSREGSTPVPETITSSDLLLGNYDPARLHPLAGLGDSLDYLALDDDKKSELPGSESALPSRGWSDDLCYGTGTMYLSGMPFIPFSIISPRLLSLILTPYHLILLSLHITCRFRPAGLALGGAWGFREGARRPLAVSNSRLRINSILNSITRRGTFLGNSAGVLGKYIAPYDILFLFSYTPSSYSIDI